MLPKFKHELASPLEQELLTEEKKLKLALKASADFHVTKPIRQKIKLLKAELSEQRMHARNGVGNGRRDSSIKF